MKSNLPEYSFFLTFLILSSIMLIRYFGMSLIFKMICKGKKPIEARSLARYQNRRDITWSVLSSFIFALNGTILISLWKNGLAKIVTGDILYIHIVNLIVFFLIHDAYFYFTHRLLHRYFFKFHRIHHLSRIPTAWTSFSFHPVEALIQAAILPVLVLIFPIHWSLFFLFLAVMSVTGFLNHLGYEFYPSFMENKLNLISASHHQHHHRDVNSNYGLYFTWWDKWLKTEALERYGK